MDNKKPQWEFGPYSDFVQSKTAIRPALRLLNKSGGVLLETDELDPIELSEYPDATIIQLGFFITSTANPKFDWVD